MASMKQLKVGSGVSRTSGSDVQVELYADSEPETIRILRGEIPSAGEKPEVSDVLPLSGDRQL